MHEDQEGWADEEVELLDPELSHELDPEAEMTSEAEDELPASAYVAGDVRHGASVRAEADGPDEEMLDESLEEALEPVSEADEEAGWWRADETGWSG
ncbi:MAG TPA: hypothetical protein VEA99_15020 [Gemmatimonadaceae bacterium]|nr:hypothetical protein [Gemmatimonadaceae bacterium]